MQTMVKMNSQVHSKQQDFVLSGSFQSLKAPLLCFDSAC